MQQRPPRQRLSSNALGSKNTIEHSLRRQAIEPRFGDGREVSDPDGQKVSKCRGQKVSGDEVIPIVLSWRIG